jgi:predicted SAM-dependent methyltransferase
LKSFVRNASLPFLRPIWRRVWFRIEQRLAPIEQRLARLESGPGQASGVEGRVGSLETAWRQHVPSFLNAVGSVAALAHETAALRRLLDELNEKIQNNELERSRCLKTLIDNVSSRIDTLSSSIEQREAEELTREKNNNNSVSALWERIEFVRREILFEMNHGGSKDQAPQPEHKEINKRVVSLEKVAAARQAGRIRLNLGCGHISLPDYLNVDRRELPGVDVIADVGDLPFEMNSVDEIGSAHLLEHFPQETVRRRLLPYWFGLLRPGGTFRAVTPDAEAMLAAAANSSYSFDDFREVVFGAQDYDGDYHYNLFTPASLKALLEEAGFTDVEVPVSGRRNGKCYEFEIIAKRA